jgi:hypothetical protein
VEYDGTWQFALSCAANGAQPAFTDRFIAPIAQNAVSRVRAGRTPSGLEDVSRFTGRIEGAQMTATLDRTRGAERWSIRFAGPAITDRRFDMAGGIFVGDRQVRSCQLVAESVTPAPTSLAATAPARAETTRQQLAAAQAELSAAQANALSEADALRTALDLARFEGAAMRAELDQRTAAGAQLTARLAAAEGEVIQARAALAQAVAGAATEIGLRDQRLNAAQAAATQQRTALEARIAAAEAGTAQAQAAAGQQRTALEARLAAAETAAGQQRTALEARVSGAEATLAQARAELETARRELTEARAAQPPR